MTKSEVYSWRLSPTLKAALEEAARMQEVSLSRLLDRMARGWLEEHAPEAAGGAAEQRLRRNARKYVGAIRGGDPGRAAQARTRVRRRLKKRRG